MRACLELAELSPDREAGPTESDVIGTAQEIPTSFLENVLSELRRAGIVQNQSGAEGATGWRAARIE